MQDLAQLLYGVFMAARLGHMITKEKIEGLNIDEYIEWLLQGYTGDGSDSDCDSNLKNDLIECLKQRN